MKQKLNEDERPGGTPEALQSDSALKELSEEAATFKADEFLNAQKLELTERQYVALIKTLELLESGGIRHDKFIDGKRFDMSHWIGNHYYCGTVCCIGGTATLLDGGKTTCNSIFHDDKGIFTSGYNLYTLFYGWGNVDVSEKRAAQQLRYYLETGACPADWAKKEVGE